MNLPDFLLARIAEDEAFANHAQWSMQGEWFATAEDRVDEFVRHNSPARVLADCDAKRRIVERHRATSPHYDEGNRLETRVLDWTLRLLALSYADHPDYRDEWRAR